MALQIWLPLTKDVRNQGVCNGSITTSGVTFADGGKLGSKYLSAGTITISASACKTFFNKNNMSFAFWLYPIGTSSSAIIMGQNSMTAGNNRMYSIFQYSTPNNLHLSWQDETSSTTFLGGVWTNFFPADVWTHCCITYNGSKAIIYRNGEEYAVANGTSNRTVFEYDYPITGSSLRKLQDVRIYNHCLSSMEVKELAKGLVLHYPLNRGGWGQENLLRNTFDFTGRSASNTTIITDSIDGTYAKTTPSAVDWTVIQIGPTFAASLISGKTITVTCEVRAFDLPTSTTTNYCYLTLNAFNSASSFSRTGNKDHSYASNVLKEGEWVTLSYQLDVNFNNWTVGSGYTTSDFQYITLGLYNHSGKRIDFRHPKLELGSIATPWCPNSSDALATTMGLNGTTEYDCSGFCNNGIRTGTFTWTSDTPKYQVSTSLNNNTSKLHISGLSTSGFGNSYSIAWWGKTNSFSGLMQWGFSDGIRLNGIFNGNLWNTGDSANNPLYIPGTTTQVSVPTTNEWHHFVMVGDGSTSKVYKDGELWGQAKTYKAISGTSIYFNGWDTSTSYSNNNGYSMSDFRIYATALSAEDVKSLYQNCATIDPDGTIRGQIRS